MNESSFLCTRLTLSKKMFLRHTRKEAFFSFLHINENANIVIFDRQTLESKNQFSISSRVYAMRYAVWRCEVYAFMYISYIYIPWNLNQGPSFVFSLWPNLLNTRSLSISLNSRLLFSNFLSLAGFVKSGIFPHLTLPPLFSLSPRSRLPVADNTTCKPSYPNHNHQWQTLNLWTIIIRYFIN